MEKKVYLILILYGILSQGICNLSEENNGKSSDILIRKKRIIGARKRTLNEGAFLVSILENGNFHFPATLLTADVAITSAHCFKYRNTTRMSIESRSPGTAGPQPHTIQRLIFLDQNYNSTHPTYKNLVLVKFGPPINFQTSSNRAIKIFSRNLAHQYWKFEVFTWGRPFIAGIRRIPSIHLRSIVVQLISFEYCQQVYGNIIGVGNICTAGTKPGEHCTENDSGAALTVADELLGIMVFRRRGRDTNPDVFMNLLDHDIRRWIHEHVPSLRLF